MAGNAIVYMDTTFSGFGQPGAVGDFTHGGGAAAVVAPGATVTGVDFQLDTWGHLVATASGDFSALPGAVSVYASVDDPWGRTEGFGSLNTVFGRGAVTVTRPPGPN